MVVAFGGGVWLVGVGQYGTYDGDIPQLGDF